MSFPRLNGKTIVAAFALAACADTGGQALFMAPTEILARQHFATLGPLLEKAGIASGVLTGATSDEERALVSDRLSSGELAVLFGTHALLEDAVHPSRCTLVVIDEQQRFGVEQRAALIAKGACPDALFLTATPIPRTLALALFGSLSLSYLHKRPRAVAPRKTFVHSYSERGQAYDAALEACKRGEQVYVVCPLVGEKRDEGEAGGKASKRTKQDELDAEQAYEFASIAIEDENDIYISSYR